MSVVDVDEILEHQLNANMLSMPYDEYSELFDSIEALGFENERLRELAAQALQIIKHVNVVMAVDWSRYSAVMSMARELGIEVPDAD